MAFKIPVIAAAAGLIFAFLYFYFKNRPKFVLYPLCRYSSASHSRRRVGNPLSYFRNWALLAFASRTGRQLVLLASAGAVAESEIYRGGPGPSWLWRQFKIAGSALRTRRTDRTLKSFL